MGANTFTDLRYALIILFQQNLRVFLSLPQKNIFAFVIPNREGDALCLQKELIMVCEKKLPRYMMPQSFQIINRKKDRFVLQLLLDKKTAVQPVLSNLIHKNKWIVWRLQEEEYQLEDIFHKLTHE